MRNYKLTSNAHLAALLPMLTAALVVANEDTAALVDSANCTTSAQTNNYKETTKNCLHNKLLQITLGLVPLHCCGLCRKSPLVWSWHSLAPWPFPGSLAPTPFSTQPSSCSLWRSSASFYQSSSFISLFVSFYSLSSRCAWFCTSNSHTLGRQFAIFSTFKTTNGFKDFPLAVNDANTVAWLVVPSCCVPWTGIQKVSSALSLVSIYTFMLLPPFIEIFENNGSNASVIVVVSWHRNPCPRIVVWMDIFTVIPSWIQ